MKPTKPTVPANLTPSQVKVYEYVQANLDCFLARDGLKDEAFQPRFKPLLVGPTGIGKSHLIRTLADSNSLPYFRLTSSDWIVLGAKTEPHTLVQLAVFVNEYPTGVIHFDEMDKFGSATDANEWTRGVNIEILNTLDGRPTSMAFFSDLQWDEDLQTKLRERFFMVGTATFQHLFQTRRDAGFKRTEHAGDARRAQLAQQIKRQELIAPELLARFNSDILLLMPLTVADTRAVLDTMAASPKFGPLLAGRNLDELAAAAVASGTNMRFFEELAGKLMIEETLAPSKKKSGVGRGLSRARE